jgi:hypothetical protein
MFKLSYILYCILYCDIHQPCSLCAQNNQEGEERGQRPHHGAVFCFIHVFSGTEVTLTAFQAFLRLPLRSSSLLLTMKLSRRIYGLSPCVCEVVNDESITLMPFLGSEVALTAPQAFLRHPIRPSTFFLQCSSGSKAP